MCAWANIETPESVNFADIVSEEISKHLQAKKENLILDASKDGWIWIESGENNEGLKNSNNSIKEVSDFSHRDYEQKSLNNNSQNELEKKQIKDSYDIFDVLEDELTDTKNDSCNYKFQSSDEVIKQYDIVLEGKKDDTKVLSLGSDFRTEDGKVLDFKSSYKFFKSLKIYFQQEEANTKTFIKLLKNYEDTMDPHTHVLLYNMIASRLLKSVHSVINAGTEGIIFCGTLDPTYQHATKDWPEQCVIKVFKKVSKSNYYQSYLYKEGHINEGKTAQWWAHKAMNNLISVRKAGVNCPQVIKVKRHILVMSFIGKDEKPAPKLRYASLRHTDYEKAYEQVKTAMKMLYEKANFIHGDMSEYNILWQDEECYFIDFSYSVSPDHGYGFYFLKRDCDSITKFFNRYIPDLIMPADELFTYITGFWYGDKFLLSKMQMLYKADPNVLHKPTEELPDNFKFNSNERVLQQKIG